MLFRVIAVIVEVEWQQASFSYLHGLNKLNAILEKNEIKDNSRDNVKDNKCVRVCVCVRVRVCVCAESFKAKSLITGELFRWPLFSTPGLYTDML